MSDFNCECLQSSAQAPPSGTCSPQSLAAPAHCCASVTNGKTTQCGCTPDGATCNSGTSFSAPTCECLGARVKSGLDNPMPVASCSPPSGGHCCKSPTYNGHTPSCVCSNEPCTTGVIEVSGCSVADTANTCIADEIAVSSCQ